MKNAWAFFAASLTLAACGDVALPLPACSAAIPGTPQAALGPEKSSACTEVGPQAVTIATAADLSVANYVTLGPAFTFAGSGPFPHGVDFVIPFSPSKQKGSDSELVVLAQHLKAPAHAALVSNIYVEHSRGLLHFHATDVATFQVGERADAGTKKMRHYTFRALGGVSMGGFGSSVNFWLHPDRYDAIGVMGADPGPDMTYSLGMIHDYFVAGFCTAADGPNKIGQLCPPARKPLTDQMEVASSFEAFTYQAGAGVGLTLKRQLYLRADRDLARAMGNPATYNPDSPYLPPGVPPSYLQLSAADQCAQPVVLKNFFDARYNPQGTYDVITFCDGNDSEQVGYGKFDPATPEWDPVQILLAVDVNGNGKRDSGEPVIVESSEPYQDVGTDGKADKDEPGYDPVENPDPDGDDYHYLWNPTGTENNWRYDPGEPYQDVGIDGVPMSVGGCPAKSGTPGCYDYGEGNGKFDYAPGIANWLKHDPRSNLEALDPSAFDRIDVYYDAGIRDFFNAQVSTNSLLGALEAKGAGVRLYDGFPALVGQAPSKEDAFDIRKVDLMGLGRFGGVRYGDPDETPAEVDATGDGRHVGSGSQAVHRAQMLLNWLADRWPDGDRAIAPVDSDRASINAMLPMQDGRMTPYTVLLPPGYFQPENASKRYPVVYFGHGLGMQPMDLTSIAIIAQQAMVDPSVPESKRMPKFIFVIADGHCIPGGDITQAALDPSGDLCEEGAFYTNHPEGKYQGEDMFLELEDTIDQMYRTRPPADLPVTE